MPGSRPHGPIRTGSDDDLDAVLRTLRMALAKDVRADVPVRAQGATSFHAVLVASELEQTHGVVVDYATVLERTPMEIARALHASS